MKILNDRLHKVDDKNKILDKKCTNWYKWFRNDQCYQYYMALKIHIPVQVHNLNELFKLLHTDNVFYCSWQASPNSNDSITQKYFRTSNQSMNDWTLCVQKKKCITVAYIDFSLLSLMINCLSGFCLMAYRAICYSGEKISFLIVHIN